MKVLCALLILAGVACAEDPLMDNVRIRYENVKLNLFESAELMPGRDYGFKPSADQMPFGVWIERCARNLHRRCAAIDGKPEPDLDDLRNLPSKRARVSALAAAFQYCDSVLGKLGDRRALRKRQNGERTDYPVAPMLSLLGELHTYYGYLAAYLRAKGLVPPSAARAAAQKKPPSKR